VNLLAFALAATVSYAVPSAIVPRGGVTTELRAPRVCLEGWRQSPVFAAARPSIRHALWYRTYWGRVRMEALHYRINCQCVRTVPAARLIFYDVPPGVGYRVHVYEDGWPEVPSLTSAWVRPQP
jgi:hypothetical protein